MSSWNHRLLIVALAMGTLSCMKTPDLNEKTSPASLAEVQNAMVQSWGTSDPLTMTPNDFLYQETEQTVEEQDPRLVLQEGITISKKEEAAKEFNYTFLYQSNVVNGNQNQQSTREDHRCVAKTSDGCETTTSSTTTTMSLPSGDATASSGNFAIKNLVRMQQATIKPYSEDLQLTLGFERFMGLAYACQKSSGLDTYCKEQLGVDSCDIQCSNLVTKDELVDAPALIKAQTNCGGFKDCKINLKRVSFDWSFISKTGSVTHTQKINYTIAVSPDMPFLSKVMEYCSRGLVEVPSSGNKVLVGVCNRVKNYKPASAN